MIAYVKGKLVLRTASYVIIETAGGIGYQIHISQHTYSQLPTGDCKLYTYFHVKEDQQSLYGFADETEKTLFTQLISVSGVGPSTAQAMLSSATPQEIQLGILGEDVQLLKGIKGIGPKTAKRIILELKDKIAKGGTPTKVVGAHNTYREEALTALLALGFAKPMAQKALNKVLKTKASIQTVEALIKEALKIL